MDSACRLLCLVKGICEVDSFSKILGLQHTFAHLHHTCILIVYMSRRFWLSAGLTTAISSENLISEAVENSRLRHLIYPSLQLQLRAFQLPVGRRSPVCERYPELHDISPHLSGRHLEGLNCNNLGAQNYVVATYGRGRKSTSQYNEQPVTN